MDIKPLASPMGKTEMDELKQGVEFAAGETELGFNAFCFACDYKCPYDYAQDYMRFAAWCNGYRTAYYKHRGITNCMKTKTAELSGHMLDFWAIKAAFGYNPKIVPGHVPGELACEHDGNIFMPSQSWEDGGPIIEREKISVAYVNDGLGEGWIAHSNSHRQWGGAPLEAAMRCIVASKFGDEVND